MAKRVSDTEKRERARRGEILKTALFAQQVTIEEMAKRLNVSVGTLYGIHRGSSWNLGTVKNYLTELGLTDDIFDGAPAEHPRSEVDDAADEWWKAQPWDVKMQLWVLGKWLVENFDEPGRFAEMDALSEHMNARKPNG